MLLKLSVVKNIFLLLYVVTVITVPWVVQSQLVLPPDINNANGSSTTYRDVLAADENLSLQWTVDSTARTITLHVETRPDGFFAFAFTRKEKLENVDLVVFGINDGKPYVYDMYGANNETIELDAAQNWRIVDISNSINGSVSLQIQRNLDSCDEEDLQITGDLLHIHWEFGNNHIIPGNFQPDGMEKIYLLDPPVLPVSSTAPQTNTSMWRIARRYRLPPRRTSYWCSIHKMTPSLNQPHHFVGYDAYFSNDVSKKHVHHQLVYRCSLPPGVDPVSVFEPFVSHPGEECYLTQRPQVPSEYCRDAVVVWAVGAKPVLFPESVGIPIGDTTNEYFMLETHYDNPEERPVDVVSGIDLLYTSQLRPSDASILILGYGVLGTFVMPPNTADFNVIGHCSKACTSQIFPTSAKILGLALHGHIQARKMRFKQYRNTVELPWVLNDDGYDFSFQQMRWLQNPVTIQPGDHMTMQCSYDNTNRNGSAIESGYSTLSEMCVSFVLIDKKLKHPFCSSEYPVARTMARYGIQNMTWELDTTERVINAANDPRLVGTSLVNVVKNQHVWTPERVKELEREQMYGPHYGSCPPVGLLSGALYYIQQLQAATGEIIPLSLLGRSTPASIETQGAVPIPITAPLVLSAYTPPQQCVTTREASTPTTVFTRFANAAATLSSAISIVASF